MLAAVWVAAGGGRAVAVESRDGAGAEKSFAGLDSVRRIRALPDQALHLQPRARIKGCITFHDPASGLTYVEDAGGGIELRGVPVDAGAAAGAAVLVRVRTRQA